MVVLDEEVDHHEDDLDGDEEDPVEEYLAPDEGERGLEEVDEGFGGEELIDELFIGTDEGEGACAAEVRELVGEGDEESVRIEAGVERHCGMAKGDYRLLFGI